MEGLGLSHNAKCRLQLVSYARDKLSRRLLERMGCAVTRSFLIGEKVGLRHRHLLTLHFNLWCNYPLRELAWPCMLPP